MEPEHDLTAGTLDFATIDGIVSDMDGVLWRGDGALPGLDELFEYARGRGVPIVLATNNSSKSRAEYVAKLQHLGVRDVAETQIVTSRTVLLEHLAQHYPAGTAIYAIGTPGLVAAIEDAGFRLSDEARVVAVGIDFDFSYDKLKRATLLIRDGADFLGTNADPSLPSADGMVPGTGAILAALETATGRAATVMGKPAPALYRSAMRALGTRPERTLMIGDRLDTDIAGGQASGMKTALVLSGATDERDAAASLTQPDAIFRGLPELVSAWRASER